MESKKIALEPEKNSKKRKKYFEIFLKLTKIQYC